MDTTTMQETLERTFDVSAPAHVMISNIRGKIDVQSGESDRVSVTAIKYLDDGNPAQTEIEITQTNDGYVHIEARMRERSLWGWLSWMDNKPCRVDFIVRVPRACNLFTRAVSASTTIDGLEGSLTAKTISGEMRLSNLSGAFDLKSISGRVSGQRLKGPLKLDTISGRVEMIESNFPTLRASTKSGRLHLETPLSEGDYRFNSISGAVTLIVPPTTRCSIDFRSVSGRVHSMVPHSERVSRSDAPIARIRFNSISGGLYLEPDGNMANREAPLDILRRIDHGELTVDAALDVLRR